VIKATGAVPLSRTRNASVASRPLRTEALLP
jgi:hypothetical protein